MTAAHRLLMGGGAAAEDYPSANLDAHYDASDAGSITSSAGRVTQWNDLSGNGRHVTATAAQRPQTGTTTINGLNCIAMTASERLRYGTDLPYICNNDQTVYAVFRKTGAASSFEAAPITLTRTNFGYPFDRYNTSWVINATTASGFADMKTQTTACQFTWIADRDGGGANSHLVYEYKNGSATASTTINTTWGFGGYVLIGMRDDGTPKFAGDVAEVLVYNAAHDTTTRNGVEDYLSTKWGTP